MRRYCNLELAREESLPVQWCNLELGHTHCSSLVLNSEKQKRHPESIEESPIFPLSGNPGVGTSYSMKYWYLTNTRSLK